MCVLRTLDTLSDMDKKYSRKIAMILHEGSKVRTTLQILTHTGTAFFWLTIIPIWYFFFDGDQRALTLGFITGFMLLPVFALKQTVRRPRPDYKDTRLGAVLMDKWSFPSGHATRSTYVVIVLGNFYPHLILLWLIWALIMISSRLLLGVHYISDILAGILISIVFMVFFWIIGWLPLVPFHLSF